MTSTASTLRRPFPVFRDGRSAVLGGGALAILLGLAVGAGAGIVAIALVMTGIAFAVGIHNWRWSIYGLLAYLPVSGLLTLALYPDSGPGALAKDFLFVLPAYAGFFGSYLSNRRSIDFPAAPTILIFLLGALVLLGAFNPELPNLLVGIIGLKVWLFYIPLLYMGYHLVQSRDDLRFLLKLMALTGLIPAIVGLIEAVLLYGGQENFVYGLYGAAAEAATQGFTEIDLGGQGVLKRIPSTFPFVTQYYVFCACMIGVAYAWWRMRGPGPSPLVRGVILGIFMLAAFTCGARGAFAFIPVLVLLIFALDGQLGVRSLGVMITGFGALLITISLIGTNVSALGGALWENASYQFEIITGGAGEAWERAYAGDGTGSDTNAARYAIEGDNPAPAAGSGSEADQYRESWWMKSILELGLLGLVLSLVLFITLIARTLHFHWRIRHPGLHATSAAFIAILLWGLMYNFKGQYIDIDPLNVYFWLFAGILFRIHTLDRDWEPEAEEEPWRRRSSRPGPRRTPLAQPQRERITAATRSP